MQPYVGQAPPPYGAPPMQPSPYGAPPQPYGAPPGPPQPYAAPYQYQQPGPPQFSPPYGSPVEQASALREPPGLPPAHDPSDRPSAWNAHAYGIVAIVLVLIGVLVVWPQLRARKVEASVRPMVQALSRRDAGARCPRYITAVLTDVGSVRLDGNGRIADHTDLTGPVCDGLRHLYAPGGRQELACLTTGGLCSDDARRSVVAISVVAHESMHLGGQLNEGGAECDSIGQSQVIATSLGIPLDEARMISWLHWTAMNPNTPPRYHVTPENCKNAADLAASPPGDPGERESLRAQIAATWVDLAT